MPIQKEKAVTLDTNDPVIKKFIEAVHKNISEKADSSRNGNDFLPENQIFEMFCADKYITPRNCAEKINSAYHYNLTPDDVIKKFDAQGIKTREDRIEFFSLISEKLNAFIKLLCYRNKNDIEAFNSAHIKLMKKFDKTPRAKRFSGRRATELERFTGRIFCLMLYIKYSELNIYNDTEILKTFGNGRAHSVYQIMFKQLKTILQIQNDDTQQENELLRSTLQMQETDIKNLNENFEVQLRERIEEFFKNLNSNKYGNILDAIISASAGIQQLHRQKIEVPLELSDLFPLINNFKNFLRDNDINPIIRLGSVHKMTKADIEKISGEYSGSPFLDANEVKTVKVISPGWYYKSQDTQISPPRLKEEVTG